MHNATGADMFINQDQEECALLYLSQGLWDPSDKKLQLYGISAVYTNIG